MAEHSRNDYESHTVGAHRIWIDEDGALDNWIAVTPDGLAVAGLSAERSRTALESVQGGAHPREALGGKGKFVPWAELRMVRANMMDGGSIHVRWGRKHSDTIVTGNRDARAGIMQAVEAGAGAGTTRTETTFGPARAALKPVIAILVTGLFGWVCFMAARSMAAGEDAEIKGRRRLVKRIFAWFMETLGPTGVAIVFGVIILGMVFWLVRRVKAPPVMVTLKPAA